ncbi:MAG: hypothetical protein KGZ39_08605 [Simkania sp.]|nr:hypothetical protein [Simkania sp.]
MQEKNRDLTPRLSIKALNDKGKLGDWSPSPLAFHNIENIISELAAPEHLEQPETARFERVNATLLALIQKATTPCFLLPAVVDFMDRINAEKILDRYTMGSFELFLNVFASITSEENRLVRAKIAGKNIPRERYQNLFPVGMGKVFSGSHFVTAHSAPDLDTTVASFWGWLDAFACRISDGLHVWNVPGGPPEGQVEIGVLFTQIFGVGIFQHTAKTRSSLSVSALDLMSQKEVIKKSIREASGDIDHERNGNAVILVDEKGYYLGDWRNFDIEGVRQVVLLLSNILRWFEMHLQMKLLGLFAKEALSAKDLTSFFKELFGVRLLDFHPVKDFSEKQKQLVQTFLVRVLGISQGLESSFDDFSKAMKKLSLFEFQDFIQLIHSFETSSLFEASGSLVENRPKIFHYLEKMVSGLDQAIQSVRGYVDRLDIALQIKTEVFGYHPQYLSSRADIEEIRGKMSSYAYLTVTASDRLGNLFPMGIVSSNQIYRPILGTVTLRDFCNREETKVPSYLEVISVVDHHKAHLQTSSTPVATISDAQSSNGMIAELAFSINDAFSHMGIGQDLIAQQIQQVLKDLSMPKQKRVLQRLLQKQLAFDQGGEYFIAPEREYIEYLHFLYAILDDTDLLTKVTPRDIECVASLLNRLKTLSLGREVEIIHFDDLPRGDISQAARLLLRNEDLYSLYRKIYHSKEESVERNILLCAEGKPSALFADTKEQNGCCRIGQTKMFAKNFPAFEKHVNALRKVWLSEAELVQKERTECDLHIHMMSTLAGAEDLYQGITDSFVHRDELWIWIPQTDTAIEHLKSFLSAFRVLPAMNHPMTEVEFLGDNAHDLDMIFTDSFLPIPRKISLQAKGLPIAVLRFKAGAINSRKAQISPYLPKLPS